MSERKKPRIFRADDPALQAAPPPSPIEEDPLLPVSGGQKPSVRKRIGVRAVFWAALSGLIALGASVAAYEFIFGLIARYAVLGWAAVVLGGIVAAGLLIFTIQEIAGLSRLRRIDGLRNLAAAAWNSLSRRDADAVRAGLNALYRNRPDMERARLLVDERAGDSPDADALLTLLERETLRGRDAVALEAVKSGARSVAAATALLPSGLLDAAAVLYLNMRMVRQVAESYGGRAGWLGSWRLMKQVAFHLAATGAIALGDDLLGAVLGGGAVAKISRKAGEGLMNGALTARIGIAAMEVSRPMPYRALPEPSVKKVAAAALRRSAKAA